jgi:predicted nicotinamide N-methyase
VEYRLSERQVAVGALRFRLRCVRDFDEAVDDVYRTLEARGEGERLVELCPFFGKLWPAARGLAARIEAGGAAVWQGLRVLELGCGLALPSLVAARLGADVVATDWHPDAERFLRHNLVTNGVEGVRYGVADWQSDVSELGRFDAVIGSDVLYDRTHAPLLARAIGRHAAPGGRILIADPGRAYLQEFSTRMAADGYEVDIGSEPGEGGEDVYVLELHRRH